MIGLMIRELVTSPGATAKKRILTKYDSAEIRQILKYTYNKEITYGVKPQPVSPINLFDRTEGLTAEELDLLNSLAARRLTGNAAHDAVNKSTRLVKLILSRDIQCGVAATTINKAMPGCIPQFKVQLAKEVPLSQVKFPKWAQLKYDGVRLIAIVKNLEVTFKTRNGKVVNLPMFKRRIEDACLSDCILDGEIVYGSGSMSDRTSVSGMINSAIHGGLIDESKLEYVLFDYLTLNEFQGGYCHDTYIIRYNKVAKVVDMLSYPITLARHQLVNSADEVNTIVNQLYRDGMEGLILKDKSHLYTFKRSKDWIKIKEIKTADLVVHTWQEGTGKYEGLIGALYCTGKVEGKKVGVFVGSGLTDIDRLQPPEYYMNETIEIKYNSIIRDSRTGEWSLFLPRFVCIRHDK